MEAVNIVCSSCGSESDLMMKDSVTMPGARWLCCSDCDEAGLQPRPLVVLGAMFGDTKKSADVIKRDLYCGTPIKASEIIP